MVASIEDQAIGQLVSKITGLQTGSSDWSRVVQKAKYKLLYEKCTSTSEMEVNDSYNGLVEKFDIKGHHDLSKTLEKYKTEYLKKSRPIFSADINQSILKYDLLRLLLTLSSSYNQNYDYIPKLNILSDNHILTWKDVIQEDPLEGDHWKTWSDGTSTDEDDLSDTGDFTLDEKNLNQTKRQRESLNPTPVPDIKVDFTDQMDIDNREDPEGLSYLMTQQYWKDGYKIPENENQDDSILVNPCKLSQALGRLLYNERGRRQLKAVTEVGIMREVLAFLRGYSGILFQSQDNTFMVNENYIVQHLSQHALGSILKEFLEYGIILSELRDTVDCILRNMDYGQTSQAFAECIYRFLSDFGNTLATLEAETSMITEDTNKMISILQLKNKVRPIMTCFLTIHGISLNIPLEGKNAREISIYLISSLYDRVLTAQSSGQNHLFDTLLYVLQQTIIPYGRIMDDWVFYGSLMSDKFNEFCVTRDVSISMRDSKFWMNGFSIPSISQNDYCYKCPMFDPPMISRIFFTGKAINLLTHLEKIQKKHNLLDAFDQKPFNDVIKENFPMKPPFIQPVHTDTVTHTQKDAYICTLFPLAKPRETVSDAYIHQERDLGDLFEQRFMYCMDLYIQEPYELIANDLNKVIHQHCELKEQLESLASIYLMLENDLMHSFCVAVFSQMDQSEPWFDQRILNQTFTDSCETSGYHEIAWIETKHVDASKVVSAASYLEYLFFKVEIPWPLNNFIQEEHLTSYSKILSFLFRLKRAKHVIEKQTLFTRRPTTEKTNSTVMHFYSLRMKMLWFINAFWRYIMTTILHAETINFRDKLSLSKDADEITALHSSYIHRLVDRCLLNEKASSIRKSIMNILDMTEQMKFLFTKYVETDQGIEELNDFLNTIEKDFNRTNEFITISLMIMGKKAGLPWFESLATSLSTQ